MVVGCSTSRSRDQIDQGVNLGFPDDLAIGGALNTPDSNSSGGCGLVTCASAQAVCGAIGDGCGDIILCGNCDSNQSCVQGKCVTGMGMCTPRTCAEQGFSCGMAGDTCGNVISCGSCVAPSICGGGGQPNVCGVACHGLCKQQVVCDGGSTTISGTVLAPTNPALGYGNPDPLPNALVYVPNGTVTQFRRTCDACGAEVSGSPLVSVASGVDGTFVLPNAPCGQNIPLVIQLGHWRRHIIIPSVQCCANTPLTADQTRFPRKQGEGGDPLNNIPLIAVQTGSVDPIECVLLKMGIDVSEFTNPSGSGRVQLYQGTGCVCANPACSNIKVSASGARLDSSTPLAANALWPSASTLAKYDAVISDCVDCQITAFDNGTVVNATNLRNVLNYVNSGGRLFASHFSYVWLYQNGAFASTAQWQINQAWTPAFPNAYPSSATGFTANTDTSFGGGMTFDSWLSQPGVGAASNHQLTVYEVRHDFNGVNSPSKRWLYVAPGTNTTTGQSVSNYGNIPLEYSFDAPVGGATTCGRVTFSDFHVYPTATCGTATNPTCTFPAECGAPGPMNAQEKVMEYMLFNLTSCVPNPSQSCAPRTCSQLGYDCGKTGDGCGNIIDCGTCSSDQTCGAGGPNVCGSGTVSCTPATCQSLGFDCGAAGDGCGGVLQCGTCHEGQTCGGAGVPNVCGAIG